METPTVSALDTLAHTLHGAVADLDAAADVVGPDDGHLLGGFAVALVEVRGLAMECIARAQAAEERSAA